MTGSALLLARIAGLAWLAGFGLLLVFAAPLVLALELGGPIIGLLTYGIWTLLLGVWLLRRPGAGVLTASALYALALFLLYATGPPVAGLQWLAYLPDATAGLASAAALVVARRQKAGLSLLTVALVASGAACQLGSGADQPAPGDSVVRLTFDGMTLAVEPAVVGAGRVFLESRSPGITHVSSASVGGGEGQLLDDASIARLRSGDSQGFVLSEVQGARGGQYQVIELEVGKHVFAVFRTGGGPDDPPLSVTVLTVRP